VEQQVTTGLPGSPSTTTTVYVGNVEEVATSDHDHDHDDLLLRRPHPHCRAGQRHR
jgi:hypothetical protein